MDPTELTPDSLDAIRQYLLGQQQSVNAAGPAPVGRTIAPGLSNYFTHPRPAPATVPNAAGKLPSSDPYEASALYDAATIAGVGAGGFGALAAGGAEAGPAIGRVLPGMISAADDVAPALSRHLPGVPAAATPLHAPTVDALALGSAAPAAYQGAMPSADAATLGPKAAQKMEMQRQGAEIEAQKARDAAALQQQQDQARAALELQTKQQQFEQQQKQQAAAAEAERQARIQAQNAPFRERNPQLAEALPYIGGAFAAGVPYLNKLKAVLANNRLVNQMEGGVARAGDVLAGTPSKAQLSGVQQEMKTGLGQNLQPTKPGLGTQIAAGAVGGNLATLVPQEMDLATLPYGDPNRDAALQQLKDPATLARALAATGMGFELAKAGSSLPALVPEKLPPVARMQGVMKEAQQAKGAITRAANQPNTWVPLKKNK